MEYTFSYREKNGSVCLVLSYKIGRKWHQKTKQGFKTQREARRYQDTLLAQVKETAGLTDDVRMKDISLRDFFSIFERDKKSILAFNTLLNYKNAISRMGTAADIPIRELSSADIANALLRLHVKASTRGGFLCNISSVLEHARKMYKIINTNPARGIQMPKDKTPTVLRAFSRVELHQLLKILESWPIGQLVVLIGAGTGMRYGEIAGLPWDAINWQKQTITVRQQLSRTASGKIGIKQCKTIRSNRTIPASIEVLEALRKWKRTTPENISGTVFPLDKMESAHKQLSRIISTHFPGRSVHALRHTFATLLLSETGDVSLVAHVLGDTVATVSNVYLNYTEDIHRVAAKAIANLY